MKSKPERKKKPKTIMATPDSDKQQCISFLINKS